MAETKTNTYANDADRSREKLAGTVDELQDRLSPRRVIEDASEAVQDRAAQVARAAGEHKLALGLIGASVGLLVLARKAATAPRAPRDPNLEPTPLQRGLDAVRETSASVSEAAAGKWQSARDRTTDLAAQAKLKASEATQFAGENFNTNPLAGAILGLAFGALAGALAPRTETEDDLLGEHRERFTDAARDAIRAAVDAGREQLGGYGLNADNAKTKLGSLREQASEIARNVGQAALDSVRTRGN